MNKKRLWIILAGVVLLICAAGLAYTVWPSSPPDPAQTSPDEIASYVASNKFGKLDDKQKQEYLAKVGPRLFQASGDLTDQQRQKIRENVGSLFRRGMEERIDEYFELSPEERPAHLDRMIDGMEAMRQARPDRTRPDRGQRPGFTPDRMKNMIENTPPKSRAKFVEFMKQMRERRRQRGLSDPHR